MNDEGNSVVRQATDAAGEVRATAQDEMGHIAQEVKSQADNVLRSACGVPKLGLAA